MLIGEEPARTANAGLDFIEHEQRAAFRTNVPTGLEITLRRNPYPALTLDGF